MAATGGEEGRREEWEGATSQDRFLAVYGNGYDVARDGEWLYTGSCRVY